MAVRRGGVSDHRWKGMLFSQHSQKKKFSSDNQACRYIYWSPWSLVKSAVEALKRSQQGLEMDALRWKYTSGLPVGLAGGRHRLYTFGSTRDQNRKDNQRGKHLRGCQKTEPEGQPEWNASLNGFCIAEVSYGPVRWRVLTHPHFPQISKRSAKKKLTTLGWMAYA